MGCVCGVNPQLSFLDPMADLVDVVEAGKLPPRLVFVVLGLDVLVPHGLAIETHIPGRLGIVLGNDEFMGLGREVNKSLAHTLATDLLPRTRLDDVEALGEEVTGLREKS